MRLFVKDNDQKKLKLKLECLKKLRKLNQNIPMYQVMGMS